MPDLKVLLPEDGESWSAFLRRVEQEDGSLLLVLTGPDAELVKNEEACRALLEGFSILSNRVRIATKQRSLIAALRRKGIRVVDSVRDLKLLLKDHPNLDEALRVFSPRVWQQRLRSTLQSKGLLSLPRLRVWILIAAAVVLFLFVLLRLLPSAEIRVRPRQDTITQTVNIFLAQSGALIDIPQRVRTLPLIPIAVEVHQQMTFDQVSKEFTGTNAEVAMTIINESSEVYSLRSGTRAVNQAGMVFRLQDPVVLQPGEEVTVRAVADDLDLYGEVIGERGNVPAGVKWEFQGLAEQERRSVYAVNRSAALGGMTAQRTVLHGGDLEVARLKLEQELLSMAKQLIDERRELINAESEDRALEILYYEELTKVAFHDFVLPEAFLGEVMFSVPVEGALSYTAYAYDAKEVLNLLNAELHTHVEQGKRLLPETFALSRLVAHVIDYDDDFQWIKLTVDLSGTEEFILDPLTAAGAQFGSRMRSLVAGKEIDVAQRIIKNLPEVESVEISLWPPWSQKLPVIPSHIVVEVVSS